MFESMIPKIVKPTKVDWSSPKYMKLEVDGETEAYEILKGADTYLHKQLGIKPATSKEVYKKSESIWKELRDLQLDRAKDTMEQFSLDSSSLLYLVDETRNLMDLNNVRDAENEKSFREALEKYIIDITTTQKTRKFFGAGEDRSTLVKLICYDTNADIVNDPFTPVVMIEFSSDKSKYKVYTGILIYKVFTFIPSPNCYLECDNLSDFVKYLNIDSGLEFATEKGQDLYDAYTDFQGNQYEMSVREVLGMFKKVGFKLELQSDDQIGAVEAISDETSNDKIQEFFNTFKFTTGESAYEIMALSELKKIFRYNKLTLLDMLGILSKEYLNHSKITCDILGDIVYNLYSKQNDKKQIESIKDEIKD